MPQVEASDNVKFNDKVVSFSRKLKKILANLIVLKTN